jgi:hypothetical protein
LIVKEADYSPDRSILELRVRERPGNPQAENIEWRARRTNGGETVYEIDIR